jgi:hypothetical protein
MTKNSPPKANIRGKIRFNTIVLNLIANLAISTIFKKVRNPRLKLSFF